MMVFRGVFELLPLRKDKKRLLQRLEQNSIYQHMSEDSLELLSVLMDSPSIWKNRKNYLNRTNINQEVESLMNSLAVSLEKACELLNCTKDYEMLAHLLQK